MTKMELPGPVGNTIRYVLGCLLDQPGADELEISQDSDYIIAVSEYWQGTASPGPFCGRKIQITNTGGGQNNNGKGKVVTATVEDTCPGCDENHLGKAW